MSSFLLIVLAIAVALCVFLYTPGPGRWLRHRFIYFTMRKTWRSGRAAIALRVVDGAQEGLRGRRWYGGTALISPGRIDFTMWVGGLPLVKRPLPPMQVTAIGTARRLRGLAWLALLDPDYEVAPLHTPTARLEIAVMPPVPGESVLARLRWPGAPPL